MTTMRHHYLRTHKPSRKFSVLRWLFPPTDNWRARYAVLAVGFWVAMVTWMVLAVVRAVVMG